MKIAVIADSQVRPGVNTDYMTHVGNYLAEKRPDVIVHLGDLADLSSLSSYNLPGEKEGLRYKKDVESVHAALGKLTKPFKSWRPRQILTLGNHENRINRAVNENPMLKGTISLADLRYEEFGFEVIPFLKVKTIAGVQFSHYFTSGVMGRPCSSAQSLLRVRQGSAVMGHVQSFEMAVHPRTQQTAIFAGVTYTHNEPYLGPQGNHCKRQILMLHEVRGGRFDLMAVSLDYLKKEYS